MTGARTTVDSGLRDSNAAGRTRRRAAHLRGVGQLPAGSSHYPSELGEGGLGDGGPIQAGRQHVARERGGQDLDDHGMWDAGRKVQGNQGVRNLIEEAAHQGPLKIEDFVIVLPCAMGERMLLAQATRSWRQGIRTLIAINGSEEDANKLTNKYSEEYNEFYVAAPDDGEGYWGEKLHARYAGDPRAAYSPVLAHRYFKGKYKWMIHGDDDTIFFLHAVRTLLKDYDHQTIHAISGEYA
eukprot:gene12435-15634_t